MVAAGGGGASGFSFYAPGGNGGSLVGFSGVKDYDLGYEGNVLYVADGGTQISGGLTGNNPYPGFDGIFGSGGKGNYYGTGGGGGGHYGGAGSGYATNVVESGAGGSSYISGFIGCVAYNRRIRFYT